MKDHPNYTGTPSPPKNVRPPPVAAPLVRGTIASVSRTKNGLPRADGPAFEVLWDDGLAEEELSLQDMQRLVRDDEKSLGARTPLAASAVRFLEVAGAVLGGAIDDVRKARALERLRDLTKSTSCTVGDVYEAAMQEIVANVLTAKKVEVWEIGSEGDMEHRPIAAVAKLDLEGKLLEKVSRR